MSVSTVSPSRSASDKPSDSREVGRANGQLTESFSANGSRAVLAGFNGNRRVPQPVNEPIKTYAPGSPERTELKSRLASMSNERIDLPLIIGGSEIHTGQVAE